MKKILLTALLLFTIKKKTTLILFIFLGITTKHISAQYNANSVFIQSPNVASLGIYTKTDISPFTGLPNISIPVFNLAHGDVPINAQLKYFGGGVKPESHPGWVGQNWTLNVGGVVTRKVNGGIDEIAVSYFTDNTIAAYLYNYNELASINWSDNSFIQSTWANPIRNSSNDYMAAPAPDEFMFSLPNGISGSFFLNHEGNWITKSTNGSHLKVKVFINEQPFPLSNPLTQIASHIKRIIYHIEITDPEGNIYTFGNNDNAIEFNRSPISTVTNNNEDIIANAWHLTKIESARGNVVELKYKRGVNQYIQSVTYTKAFKHSITNYVFQNYGFGGSSIPFNPRIYSAQIISPCYLDEISSNSFRINFEIEQTTELKYSYDSDAFNGFPYYDLNIDNLLGQDFLSLFPPKWYKLNSIKIYDHNNTQVEDISFSYNDDQNQRLFLKKFSRNGSTNLSQDYNFAYDLTPLPEYNSFQIDRWGYYNGKTFPTIGNFNNTELLAYLEPDADLMQAGTLLKITNPTGGYTQFYYEPNTYSQELVKQNANVALEDKNGIGGGIRIKKIIENSWDGIESSREYLYQYNAFPTMSSGISSGSKKIYFNYEIGSNPLLGTSEYITTNTLEDLNYTNGREVVYSEVKEKFTDGSYNIYKFSNSDNITYRDEAPISIFSQSLILPSMLPSTWVLGQSTYLNPIMAHSSRESERGNLLSMETYNSLNKIVYKLTNEYRDDSGRFNEFVRSIDRYSTNIVTNGEVKEDYLQPIKIYTYYPYLKKQTESNFNSEGTAPITLVKSFTYDHNYNFVKEQKTFNSNNVEIKTVFRYPPDIMGVEDENGIYSKMTQRNLISPVIEEKKYTADQQVSLKRNNYFEPSTNKFLLRSIKTQQTINDQFEIRVQYSYDEFGNIISQSLPEGTATSYLWGYRKQVPVGEIKNALPTELYYNSFEDNGVLNPPPAHTGLNYHNGNSYSISWQAPNTKKYVVSYWYLINGSWLHKEIPYSANLILTGGDAYDDISIYPSNALLNTYTYKPLVGLSSEIDNKNETTFYEYDSFNRLTHIKNKESEIVKTYQYNFRPKKFGNVPVFKKFTRQCGPGYIAGPPLAYSLPANKYIANTQEEADSLALADLNSNGQQYANEHGECNVVLEEVNFVYLDGIIGENAELCYVTLQDVNSSQYYSVVFKNIYDQTKLNIPAGEYDLIIDFPNPLSYYYNGGFDYTNGIYVSFFGVPDPSSQQFIKRVSISGNTIFSFTFSM